MNGQSGSMRRRATDGGSAIPSSPDVEQLVRRVEQLEAHVRRRGARHLGVSPFMRPLRLALVALAALVWVLSPAVTLAATLPNTWSSVSVMPTARGLLASTTAPCPGTTTGECVYAIGGYSNGYLQTVEAYNPATNAWTSSGNGGSCASAVPACMPTPRESSAAATAPCPGGSSGECVYVIGGYNNGVLQTVEAYNPATNMWTSSDTNGTCASVGPRCMPTSRYDLSAATAPCPTGISTSGRCIYAIGGYYPGGVIFQTVEVYDPSADTWTSSGNGGSCASATPACMPTARAYLAAATASCTGSVSPCVYAFGGFNSSGSLNTVEMYNPATNVWTPSTSGCTTTPACMPTFRDSLAATTAPCPGSPTDQCVFAIGGHDGTGNQLQTVEAYNPAVNSWTSSGNGGSCASATPACMPTPRQNPAAATAPCPNSTSGQCVYTIGAGSGSPTVEVYSGNSGLIVGGLPGLLGLGSGASPPAAPINAGVYGGGSSGYGGYFHSETGSPLHLDPGTSPTPPSSGQQEGDIYMGSDGSLWICTGTASPCTWQHTELGPPPTVHLQSGWNLTSGPYPTTGLGSDTIVQQINGAGGNATAVAIYTNSRYQIYVPNNSTPFQVSPQQGMFILATKASTWSPH